MASFLLARRLVYPPQGKSRRPSAQTLGPHHPSADPPSRLRVQLATSWIQSIYYGITIRAGDAKPASGSARFLAHRRTINVAVVVAYLLFTLFEAEYELSRAPTFYDDLGVSSAASDRDIRSRFRRLAAVHHPDKAGNLERDDAAAYFMHLKLAADTLQDAAKRFTYERFGPEIVEWKACVVKDYVYKGVLGGILPYYVGSATTIYALSLLGYFDVDKFQRWLILMTLVLFELYAVIRPTLPAAVVINTVVSRLASHAPYLPFQVLQLTRKAAITLYIAISQLGPLLAGQARARQRTVAGDEQALQQGLQRLETAVVQLEKETSWLVALEMAPFQGDPAAVSSLQGKMHEWLVHNTIRSDPLVRDALGTSLRKRRTKAPHGVRPDG